MERSVSLQAGHLLVAAVAVVMLAKWPTNGVGDHYRSGERDQTNPRTDLHTRLPSISGSANK